MQPIGMIRNNKSITNAERGRDFINSMNNIVKASKNHSMNNDILTNSNLNMTPHHYSSYKRRIARVNRNFTLSIDKKASQNEIEALLKLSETSVFVMDVISALFDIIILIWTYLNHFTYNKQGYTLTTADNIQRLICLGLSMVTITFLIVRLFLTKRIQVYQYLLLLRAASMLMLYNTRLVPTKQFKVKWLLIEVLVHLFQLYPFVSVTFHLGDVSVYSLNMLFFFLSIFRVYVFFKLFFSWNFYFSGRAKRLFQLFNIKVLYPSIYRIGIKFHSYFTLFTIFIFLLLASSYIFKVFENWHPNESDSEFGSLLTCLWYILTTMLNIGYGDYVPVTVLGRLVSVFVCFAGLFLKSILTATLFTFAIMVDDGEQKAYTQINLLYSKNQTKSLANFYYTSYIKNKFKRLTSLKYKIENITKWQNMNQLRERYYLRVLSHSKLPLTIKDFCGSLNNKWDSFGKEAVYNVKEVNRVVEEFTEFCIESLKESNMKIIKCMGNSYQMANLCYLILFVGGLYHIESYDLVKNSRLISKKDYEVKCKEFKMKYADRCTSSKLKGRNYMFRTELDSKEGSDEDNDEEESDEEKSNETFEVMSDNYSESLLSLNQDGTGSKIEQEIEEREAEQSA